MARKSGLGPQGKSAIDRYVNIPDSSPGIPRYTTPDDKLSTTKIGNRALFASGSDFDIYLLDLAPTYFQGPSRSTRVKAHQFIPLDSSIKDALESGDENEIRSLSKQFDASIRGHIYVKFWKNGPKGDEWKYGPCTLHDYRTFRESASKGRSVVGLEGFGHGPSPDNIFSGI